MMGYDYSGGGLNGPNRHMADAIKALRAGQTRGQESRALMDRIALVAGTTGVGAIGHMIEARHSENAQAERDASVAGAARKVSDDKIRASSQQYAAPDYDPGRAAAMGHSADVPAWLTQAQGHAEQPLISDLAKEAQDTQQMNKAAAGAPIGGHRPPAALDAADKDSDVRAADISTGKNLMNSADVMDDGTYGGMGRSLRRR